MVVEIIVIAGIIGTVLYQEDKIKKLTDYIAEVDNKCAECSSSVDEIAKETDATKEWRYWFDETVKACLNHFEKELHEVLDKK